MASKELDTAIQLQGALLQDFVAAQNAGQGPADFRAIYSRFHSQFPVAEDVRFDPVSAGSVPAEWMIPPGASSEHSILYLHGGGYVVGAPKDYREMVPRIARAAQARALFADYRLAPEHPHPAAVEDAVAAYRWLLANGARPGGIVVAGDSAGGGLTVAALVALRDQGVPLPAAGVCLSPWVDLEMTGESMDANAAADPLVKKELVAGMAAAYLAGQDARTPLASPLYADLQGLPPLLILVGTSETLLDDARRLAERAKAAGVDVTYEPWSEMIHVWQWLGSILPEARQSIDRIGEFIKERTGRTATVA